MFRAMVQQFGTIDILVNNAGLQRDSAFHEMTLAAMEHRHRGQSDGQFLCAREAIREFLRRGIVPSVSCAAGKIICMSSVHQEIPWGGHANYATSKGGIKLMMESLAQEIAPHAYPRQRHRPRRDPYADQYQLPGRPRPPMTA